MKIAIFVPDDIFAKAERLAERTAKSRSQLYTDAMREYLARHDPDSVTERLDAVADAVSAAEDRFVAATARKVLEEVEW